MKWYRVFLVVTGCSIIGMLMGGLFGLAAGSLSIPWHDVEPRGVATFLGATAGIVLGGCLGCFGILVQLIVASRQAKSGGLGRLNQL